MRSPFAPLMIGLLSLCVAACGGAGKGMRSTSQAAFGAAKSGGAPATAAPSARPTRGYLNDGDNDPNNDNDPDDLNGRKTDDDNDSPEDHMNPENNRYHDKDDNSIVDSGHAASAADKQVVTALVKRYYATAAAGDGTMACSMIVSSLARATPEDYGQAPGPYYLRGAKTCAAVMSLLFKHFHGQLTGAIEVTGVRVEGNQARVLLGSTTMPAGYISVERERGAWKIDTLLGGPLP
jgi:hypothetical protein